MRGRPPKGRLRDKKEVLSFRVTAETRRALEAAAQKSGKSLAQECEERLRDSFQADQWSMAAFGSSQNFAVLRLLAVILAGVRRRDDPAAEWSTDPYLFDKALKAINATLKAMRPEGEAVPPSSGVDRMVAAVHTTTMPRRLMREIMAADPSWELSNDKEKQVKARLKRDLSHLIDRRQSDKRRKSDAR